MAQAAFAAPAGQRAGRAARLTLRGHS